MISKDDIQQFLPTFLSQGSETAFLDEIKAFTSGKEGVNLYTASLNNQPYLFQGDGLKEMLIVNLPGSEIRRASAMLFSNTCDVSPDNPRLFPSSLSYAPIFSLNRYLEALRGKVDAERLALHERNIRSQLITQIFFLPKGGQLPDDSLVFLDRTLYASSNSIDRDSINAIRLFTLSDFGAWLFALKLSIHFCRFRDKVDRVAGHIH